MSETPEKTRHTSVQREYLINDDSRYPEKLCACRSEAWCKWFFVKFNNFFVNLQGLKLVSFTTGHILHWKTTCFGRTDQVLGRGHYFGRRLLYFESRDLLLQWRPEPGSTNVRFPSSHHSYQELWRRGKNIFKEIEVFMKIKGSWLEKTTCHGLHPCYFRLDSLRSCPYLDRRTRK